MKGTKKDLTERLMEISLFAAMSREQVADAVRRIGGELRQFKKGEAVVYEGTKSKWVVPVLSGRLTIYESGSGGVRRSVRVVEAGQLFGSTMVTSNLEYYPGAAVASEPSEVVFLSIPNIRELWYAGTHPKFFAFNGKKFDAGKAAKVSCKKGVLAVDTSKGDNVTGLKLAYSKGVLKGSFTVYAISPVGKLVKNKFTVAGVMIDGVGYAVGTNKKLQAIPFVLAK